uniref:Uncharacterized protein n=1 Tax=Tetranychus urticae TaxID=32264 RepID=T1K350_TETUR
MADDAFALIRQSQAPILNHADKLLAIGCPPTSIPTTANPSSPESVRIVPSGGPIPTTIGYYISDGPVPHQLMQEAVISNVPVQSPAIMENNVSSQTIMDYSTPSVAVPSPDGMDVVISNNSISGQNMDYAVSGISMSSPVVVVLSNSNAVSNVPMPVSNDSVANQNMDYSVPSVTMPVSNDSVANQNMDYSVPSVATPSSSVAQNMDYAISIGPMPPPIAAVSNVGSDYGHDVNATLNGIQELTQNDVDKLLEPYGSPDFADSDSIDSLDTSFLEALKNEDIETPFYDGLVALVFSLVSHNYPLLKNKTTVETIEIPQVDGTSASLKFGSNHDEVSRAIFHANLDQANQLKENLLKYRHNLPVVESPPSSIGDNLIGGSKTNTEMEPISTSDNDIGDKPNSATEPISVGNQLNSTAEPISVGNTEICDITIHTMPNPYATNPTKSTSTKTPTTNSSKTSSSIDILESIVTSVAIETENRLINSSSSVFDTPPLEDDDDPYKLRMEEDKASFQKYSKNAKPKKANNLNVDREDRDDGDDGDDGGKNNDNDGNKNREENIKKGTSNLESIRAELDTVDEILTDDEDDDQFDGLIDDDADREITYLLNKNTFDLSIFKDNREPRTSYKKIKPKYQEFKPINIKPRPPDKKTVKTLKLVFDSNLDTYEWPKDSPIKYPFSVDPSKIYTLDGINRITDLFRNKIHYADFKHYATNTSDDLVEFRLALGYVLYNTSHFVWRSYEPLFYLGELEMLTYCYWELSTQDVLNMDLTPTKKKTIKILLQQAAKDFATMPVANENKDKFDSFYFEFKHSCLFNNPELTYIDMLAIKERFTKIHQFINESELSFDDKEDAIWIWYNIFQQANCHHYMVPYTRMKCWAMLNQFVTHLEYFSQIPSNKFSLDGLKELSKTFIESVYGDKFTDKNARSTVASRILYFIDRFAYTLKFLNKEILDKNEFADAIKSIPFIGDIENDFIEPAVFSETFKNSFHQPPLDENAVAANTRKRKATESPINRKHPSIPSTSTANNNDDNNDEDDDEYEPRCKIFKRYNDPDFWRGKEKPNDKGENKCMLCYKGRSPRAFKFYQNFFASTA